MGCAILASVGVGLHCESSRRAKRDMVIAGIESSE